MQGVTYHAPETLAEACDLLDRHGDDARVLAGGQSLIQLLKQRLVGAEHVVDIGGIDGLGAIRVDDDALRVGAMATYADVRRDAAVRSRLPVLPEMIATVGDRQVRARGTLVGGVAHADPDGDPPVLATALDATIHLRGAGGERSVRAGAFYQGLFETAMAPDELVTAVDFPLPDDGTVAAYRSFTPRMGDYAVASVALVADASDDATLVDPRVVAGGVADTPRRLPRVEEAIDGTAMTDDRRDEVAATAREAVDPVSDAEFDGEYRRSLLGTLVVRAVTAALDG